MANHSKQTVLAIYSLASILSLTTASSLRAAEPTESNQTRTISDQNGDGWDDLWVYMFGRWVDLKDPNRDSNEDGVSDFQCMLAFRDPMSDFHWKYGVQGAGLPSASELKEADAATIARREATWAETKQRLAPWTNQRVRLSDGKLATLAPLTSSSSSPIRPFHAFRILA